MRKDLGALIRLHQHRVDEKRRSLGELLNGIATLEKRLEYLEKQILSEQVVANSASDSVGMFYGEFAKEAVSKRAKIVLEISDIEKKIIVAQEEMRSEYNDLKIFEISQETRDEISAMETSKTEQQTLDELGQEAYRRRR
jgi:flagellar biosynthesis chaperone FliJ